MTAPADILTTAAAAAALGISASRLRSIVDAGIVTPARHGRALAWTAADLEELRPRIQGAGQVGRPIGSRNRPKTAE